jgi:hypothetical protein
LEKIEKLKRHSANFTSFLDMEILTLKQLSQAFFESLGNQGLPVVEEILENFSDSVVSIVVNDQVLIEIPLDLEALMHDTEVDLKMYLQGKNVPFVSNDDMFHSHFNWEVNGVEYGVSTADGEVFSRELMFHDPAKKIRVWYLQNYYSGFRIAEVQIEDEEVQSNLKSECRRFFGPLPPR